MIKSTEKKEEVSLTNGTHKKCNTINKTFSFKDQCKENTMQQLGKFVCNNLVAVKINKKL